MSFGYSVSDAVLVQLASRTVQNAQKDRGEHDDLKTEVASVYTVFANCGLRNLEPRTRYQEKGWR